MLGGAAGGAGAVAAVERRVASLHGVRWRPWAWSLACARSKSSVVALRACATLSCSRGMGLQLLGEKCNEWCVVCPGLSGLIGNLSSLCCVESFGDGIEVKPFVSDVLKQMSCKDRLGDTS